MVAPSPLPDLPQRHLLTALLELNADLPAVAARTRTPLDELTRWAHSEAVHAWLEAHNHFAKIARQHRELARITRNLDDLEKLAATTTDPIEKRRTLTTILRTSTAILTGRALRSDPLPRGRAGEGLARDPRPAAIQRPAPDPIPAPHHPRTPTRPSNPLRDGGPPTGLLLTSNQQPSATSKATTLAPLVPSVPSVLSDPSDISDLRASLSSPRQKRRTTPAHLLAAAGLPAP